MCAEQAVLVLQYGAEGPFEPWQRLHDHILECLEVYFRMVLLLLSDHEVGRL